VTTWEACSEDAVRRDAFQQRKREFLNTRSLVEKQALITFDSTARDDSTESPGSDRGDEEERLFHMSLSDVDRGFIESHKGLGNSQKAEVAWLDKMGYLYEQVDVRDFRAPN
jgi:hypothetical protein